MYKDIFGYIFSRQAEVCFLKDKCDIHGGVVFNGDNIEDQDDGEEGDDEECVWLVVTSGC